MMEGELQNIGLVSVVQLLCTERLNGGLFLRRRDEEGRIFFADGEVVHAVAGPLSGEDAIYHLLAWTEGSFRVSDEVTIPDKSIALSWNHLILEGLRKIDEGARSLDTARPPATRAPSKVELERDAALENDLLQMLSTLEQAAARLEDKKTKKRPLAAVEMLAEMANYVIEVGEKTAHASPTDMSLIQTLRRVSERIHQMRLVRARNNRLSVATVVNLYQSWGDDPSDRAYMFHQISRGLVAVMESYFSVLARCLRSDEAREQWAEASAVFLTEAGRIVDRVPF